MKNTSMNSDGSVNVSDLEGNHRYKYYIVKDSTTPKIDILCEGKIYNITEINLAVATSMVLLVLYLLGILSILSSIRQETMKIVDMVIMMLLL